MAVTLLQGGIHVLLIISLTGAEVPIPVQIVPQGIESVNGSDVSMGCASPLVNNSNSVVVCGSPCESSESYLVDGNSPAINTNTPNWASQLVTVRKNKKNNEINFDHVVLTFGFDTAVSPTAIELDLFLCPEGNIGAPYITVYADNNTTLVFRYRFAQTLSDTIIHYTPNKTSCDSLSTVSIPVREQIEDSSYFTWHIVVDFTPQPDIEWVHVGEVTFVDVPAACPNPSSVDIPEPTGGLISSLSLVESTPAELVSSAPPSSTPIPMEPTYHYTTLGSILTAIDSTKCSTTLVISASLRSTVINNPTENDSVPVQLIALVAGIIGLVLLVLILVFVVGYSFIRRHYQSKVQLKAVQNVVCEMKDITKEQDGSKTDDPHSDNDQFLANRDVFEHEVCNPMYYTIHKPVPPATGGLYDEIATDKAMKGGRHNVITTNTQKATNDKIEDEGMGMYDLITPKPVVTTTKASAVESPVYMSVRGEEQHYTIPEISTNAKVEKEVGSAQLVYSGVQQRKVPVVPPKSSDLEMYLATHSAFNEGIYSESINPSDFMHGSSQESEEIEEKESNLQIFAPIHTVPTMLPEDYQQPVEVTSDSIKEREELGTGQFGQVVLATMSGLSLKDTQLSKTDDNQETSILVAVKKLKPNPLQVQQETFDKEVKFMSCLKHHNIVCALGVCYSDPAFIVMEYMEEGNLSQFLQRYSEIIPITTPSNNAQLTTPTVVHMASQIASAMQYLAGLTFVHRDLATRNCLVGTNFTVKVADLGVNVNLYRSHYYRVKGNMLLPIRWMATECFDGNFSEKSDVWAFGITMWELFTLAKEKPYPNLSDEEVIHNALKRKYHQFPSKACPQPVYEIMEKCWVIDLKQRATFQELHEMLQKYLGFC